MYIPKDISVYNNEIDSTKYGTCMGYLRRASSGDSYTATIAESVRIPGSRSVECVSLSSCKNQSFAARSLGVRGMGLMYNCILKTEYLQMDLVLNINGIISQRIVPK